MLDRRGVDRRLVSVGEWLPAMLKPCHGDGGGALLLDRAARAWVASRAVSVGIVWYSTSCGCGWACAGACAYACPSELPWASSPFCCNDGAECLRASGEDDESVAAGSGFKSDERDDIVPALIGAADNCFSFGLISSSSDEVPSCVLRPGLWLEGWRRAKRWSQ